MKWRKRRFEKRYYEARLRGWALTAWYGHSQLWCASAIRGDSVDEAEIHTRYDLPNLAAAKAWAERVVELMEGV